MEKLADIHRYYFENNNGYVPGENFNRPWE